MKLTLKLIFQSITLFILIVLLVNMQTITGDAMPTHKNILIINSYSPSNPWTQTEINGLQAGLEKENLDIVIYQEYMDAKRVASEAYDTAFTNYLSEKYKMLNIDLIVTTDDYATVFVEQNQSLFLSNKVPVVFVGLNDLEYQAEGLVGVYEHIDIKDTVSLIQLIHGENTPILVVTDKTQSSLSILKDVIGNKSWLSENRTEIFSENNYTEIKKKLVSFDQGAIIFLLFNEDSEGNKYTYYEGLEQIKNCTALPIYSTWDFYIGHGIVGGSVITEKEMGESLARIVARILNGEDIQGIKSQETKVRRVLDYQIMAKFGIEKTKVQNQAEIINQPINIWSEYYQLMMLFVGTVFIFVVIIGLLFNNIHQKNEYYRAVSEHKSEMMHSNQKLEKKLADSLNINNLLIEQNGKLLHMILSLKKKVGFSERFPSILHEINTMLGNIHARMEYMHSQSDRLMRNERELTPELQFEELQELLSESLSVCEMSMGHTVQLVSATKTCYSDLNQSEFRNYKIHGFIEAFWQMLKPTLKKKKVSFIMKVSDDLSLYGNPGDFLAILGILFGNSLKHGYPILQERGMKIEIEAYASQSFFHFIYRDDGVGCSTEILEKGLQMPIESAVLSSGIGLYQLNMIVTETMGGQITISGDDNEGIQVRINIPKAGEHDVK